MSSQQLLISYGGSGGLPVGDNWWVANHTFGNAPTQRQMYTGEQGVTGKALVLGGMGTGYTLSLRNDEGVTYGTPRCFTTSGWTYAYGEFALMTSDNYLLVGVKAKDATKTRTVINKHNPDGTLLWTRYLDVAETTQQRPPCFAVDSTGAVYSFIQPSFNTMVQQGAVMKMNASGLHLWTRYTEANLISYNNRSIKINNAGQIYTCFPSTVGAPAHPGFTVSKRNSDGSLVWGKQHGFIDRYPSNTYLLNGVGSYGFDIDKVSGDSYILASGETSVTHEMFLYLLKIDNSGVLQWSKRVYHSMGSSTARAGDVVVTAGGVVAAVQLDNTGFIFKVDFSGNILSTVEVHPGTWIFNIYLAQLSGDGNGNLVLSHYGSSYAGVPPFTIAGFTSKFPDDLSKVGSWAIDGTVNLTMTSSTYVVVGVPPDTVLEDVLASGTYYYEMYDGAGMFTESSDTLTTTITAIT